MANRLADLNRQKRDVAFSGGSTIGDVPWLYALQAEQAAANQPAGIGQPGGGAEAEGAPNPQAVGVGGGAGGSGGASGGADAGLPGPGLDGIDNQFYDFMQAQGRGGQAGEPGGAGAGGVEFGDPNAFVDPTLAEWTGYLAPGPIGWVGSLGAAGMRAHNAGLLDEAARAAGGTGLSGWQMAGAALGSTLGNEYGAYGYEDTANALNAAGAGRAAGTGGLGAGAGGWADAVVDLGPRERENRTGSWAGGLDDGGSAFGGGADRGGDGGGSRGGGQSGSNTGGERSDRGTNTYHSGGYVSESNDPNQRRGDVEATLQEGEGVLTADALEVLGPGFVYGVNMMAKMMRGRG